MVFENVYDETTKMKLEEEFPQLSGVTYLDHAGTTLFSKTQIESVATTDTEWIQGYGDQSVANTDTEWIQGYGDRVLLLLIQSGDRNTGIRVLLLLIQS